MLHRRFETGPWSFVAWHTLIMKSYFAFINEMFLLVGSQWLSSQDCFAAYSELDLSDCPGNLSRSRSTEDPPSPTS